MPIRFVLLRVLLCLCLVLQATGAAWAAARMPAMEASTKTAAVSAVHAPSPCPGHAAARASMHDDAGTQAAGSKAPGHPKSDCCKSGGCIGACAASMATMPTAPVMQHAPAHDAAAASVSDPYDEPALAHRIRPPIA